MVHQLLGQRHVPHHEPRLPRQVADELVLRGGDRLPGRFTIDSAPSSSPWCRIGSRISVADTSPASSSVAAIGGKPRRPAATGPRRRAGPRCGPTRRRGRLRCRRQGSCHPGQEVLVRVRVAEPFGELREHFVRCRALPIDELVGEPLGTLANRLERERDDRRGDGGQDRIRAAPDERADADDDRDVDDGDEHGERTEQHCTVDDDVDVEQVVPQHRHTDRDRDQPEREDRDVLKQRHPGGLIVRGPRAPETDEQGDRVEDRDDRCRRHQPSKLEPLDPNGPAIPLHERDERSDHPDREDGDAGDRDRERGAQPLDAERVLIVRERDDIGAELAGGKHDGQEDDHKAGGDDPRTIATAETGGVRPGTAGGGTSRAARRPAPTSGCSTRPR